VLIVPGLAVRSYAIPAAQALRARGYRVHLLRPPAWHGAPTDLDKYGRLLAEQIEVRGDNVDLLVGLSVGTQAAAVAAGHTDFIRRLVLISPTVDPRKRTIAKLLGAWMFGSDDAEDPGILSQLPDWWHAGLPRIAAGFFSALRVPLERVLPDSKADLTIVHAEHDGLGSAEWGARLANENDGRYYFEPDAPHSWPIGDERGFADLVDRLLREGKSS
jgi:hypothetical protein